VRGTVLIDQLHRQFLYLLCCFTKLKNRCILSFVMVVQM